MTRRRKRGDDHTLAIFTNIRIATPVTRKESAQTVKDFTPLVRLVLEPTIAVVRADSPYRSKADFVAAAKKDPGSLKQAGGSATAIESLTGLLIQSATGAKWTFITTTRGRRPDGQPGGRAGGYRHSTAPGRPLREAGVAVER